MIEFIVQREITGTTSLLFKIVIGIIIQIKFFFTIYWFVCLFLQVKNKNLCPRLRPVSYTHLDVYKRQATHWVDECVLLSSVCTVTTTRSMTTRSRTLPMLWAGNTRRCKRPAVRKQCYAFLQVSLLILFVLQIIE